MIPYTEKRSDILITSTSTSFMKWWYPAGPKEGGQRRLYLVLLKVGVSVSCAWKMILPREGHTALDLWFHKWSFIWYKMVNVSFLADVWKRCTCVNIPLSLTSVWLCSALWGAELHWKANQMQSFLTSKKVLAAVVHKEFRCRCHCLAQKGSLTRHCSDHEDAEGQPCSFGWSSGSQVLTQKCVNTLNSSLLEFILWCSINYLDTEICSKRFSLIFGY